MVVAAALVLHLNNDVSDSQHRPLVDQNRVAEELMLEPCSAHERVCAEIAPAVAVEGDAGLVLPEQQRRTNVHQRSALVVDVSETVSAADDDVEVADSE